MRFDCQEIGFSDLLAEPLRNGLTRPRRVRGTGSPMVNMGELFANRRIDGEVHMERVPLPDKNPERDLLRAGDLLFARQSLIAEGAGKVSIFQGASEATTFESHLIRARLDPSRGDPAYWFYYFESPQGRDLMRSIVTQVAAAGVRGSDLARLRVPAPAIRDQRRAAGLLRTLDDKIDSNRRLAVWLEETAAALFRARFVDFVEVGELEDSELGRIPRGWRVGRLADIASLHRDLVTGESELPYIGLDAMPRGSAVLSEWATDGAPTGQASLFAKGDVLFGKLRPYFHKVGVAPLDGRCSTEILVVRPIEPAYYGPVLGHVSSGAFIDYCVSVSRGTRMPRAEWKDASGFRIVVPPAKVAQEFSDVVRVLYAQIIGLTHESRTLAAARDALLPKLISGEIRVPDNSDPAEVVEPLLS